MRPRTNEDSFIFIDSDTYQTAYLNIQLPPGVKLEFEDHVVKAKKRREEQQRQTARLQAQEERKRIKR